MMKSIVSLRLNLGHNESIYLRTLCSIFQEQFFSDHLTKELFNYEHFKMLRIPTPCFATTDYEYIFLLQIFL